MFVRGSVCGPKRTAKEAQRVAAEELEARPGPRDGMNRSKKADDINGNVSCIVDCPSIPPMPFVAPHTFPPHSHQLNFPYSALLKCLNPSQTTNTPPNPHTRGLITVRTATFSMPAIHHQHPPPTPTFVSPFFPFSASLAPPDRGAREGTRAGGDGGDRPGPPRGEAARPHPQAGASKIAKCQALVGVHFSELTRALK